MKYKTRKRRKTSVLNAVESGHCGLFHTSSWRLFTETLIFQVGFNFLCSSGSFALPFCFARQRNGIDIFFFSIWPRSHSTSFDFSATITTTNFVRFVSLKYISVDYDWSDVIAY